MSIVINSGITINPGNSFSFAPRLIVFNGLVSYLDVINYPGSGTVWPDDSGNGNDGTLADPDYQAGPPAYLNFNGTNYAIMGNVLSATAYTKCAMIYINSYQSNNILSGRGGSASHAFWLAGTHYLNAGHNNAWSTITGSTELNLNQWYFVAVTFDSVSDGWKLYVNGVIDGSDPNLIAPQGTSPSDVNVGAFQDSNNFYGRIPIAMIYNRALSDLEILTNFNALRNRFGI